MDDDDDNPGSTVPSKIKVPPIIVDVKCSFISVIKTVGTSYKYRVMSIGTKIESENVGDYKRAIDIWKAKNMEFYTHKLNDP